MAEQDTRFRSGNTKITDRRLYEERLCRILNEAGMVRLKEVTLGGHRITVADRYKPGEYPELWYCYYNEDMRPEPFDPEDRSMRVGGKTINTVKIAVETLESIMTEEGVVVPSFNGTPCLDTRASRWLTTLFETPLTLDTHIWDIFIHLCRIYSREDGVDENVKKLFMDVNTWMESVLSQGGFGQVIGIISVLNGTEPIELNIEEEELFDENGKLSRLGEIRRFITKLDEFHASSKQSDEEQFNALIQTFCRMYRFRTPPDDSTLAKILVPAAAANIPEFAVLKICEVYDRDFWKTWEMMQEKGVKSRPMKELMDFEPLTTNAYLNFSYDDTLLNYRSGTMDQLSDDVRSLFKILRTWYRKLEKDTEKITPDEIINILEYAEKHYYRIHTFSNFLNYTASHLQDKEVQTLWKTYRRLLHDPLPLRSAGILFNADGSLHRPLGLCPPDMRMNMGRRAVKRFNMITANPVLLKEALGITLEY